MEIILSPLADETLNEILEFVNNKFSEKEVLAMKMDILHFKETLEAGIFKPQKISAKNNYYQYLLRSKQATVIYEIVDEDYIKILLFWANKKDPRKLEKLLKSI